ncbi:hypothetical protein FNF29_00627 [Cafeteria roenbergensis]|uniref:E2 ubiquitin-conjugating enzyme n=1 Tax=Cafeteria roenbergensis TaxID=33653 RepID=A0A5A8CW63_CAFRO|nr:hypothetical protein FNF29_00627 [Cafeteria roenbergensis]|eukprot:KAA0157275.1 hypothetical protein FNF29_00627 [Cafeteria roenbergensis]
MADLSASTMSIIAKQIKALVKRPLDGVRYVPDHGSLTEVHAIIQGPERTPYEGGEFRVKLMLGADYPSAPPKGVFLTKIYHPNISTAGDICVNTLKRDWKPEIGLAHVLQVVRCLLIVPFPESSLNDDAGRLFMESYDEFARRAKLMTGIHAKPAAKPAGAKKASAKAASAAGGAAAAPPAAAAAAATAAASGPDAEGAGSATPSSAASAAAAAATAVAAASGAAAAPAAEKPSRKSTHDEGRGASTAGNENKKSRLDKSASDKASKKAADKKKKDRKALKRL